MTLAATVGDAVSGCEDYGDGTLVTGHAKLTIEGQPVCCVGDIDSHGHSIVSGSAKLYVDGVAVARVGDALDSGGVVATGKSSLNVNA